MKRVKLEVCQGVGDIFWVYQKFAPHVDVIDFAIMQVSGQERKLGTRAEPFMRLWPKVGDITMTEVTGERYTQVATCHFDMTTTLSMGLQGRTEPYCCNLKLEQGVRIEDIDPMYAMEVTTPMQVEPCPLAFQPGEYIALYVSGATADRRIAKDLKLWDTATWVRFVKGFQKQYGLRVPVILIGAAYDEKAGRPLEKALKESGMLVHSYFDPCPANVTYILKNSICFLNYQSGLGILADNLDTKQVMLYFPALKKMMNTWCKMENWRTGRFNADTFDQTPERVLDGLRLSF